MTRTQPTHLTGPHKNTTHGIPLIALAAGDWRTPDGLYRVHRYTAPEACANAHPGCPGGVAHEKTSWMVSRGDEVLAVGLPSFKAAARWLARRVRG